MAACCAPCACLNQEDTVCKLSPAPSVLQALGDVFSALSAAVGAADKVGAGLCIAESVGLAMHCAFGHVLPSSPSAPLVLPRWLS